MGGGWQKIEDKFLIGASSNYDLGSTGGTTSHFHTTEDHTLTINEMPSHAHSQYIAPSRDGYPDGADYTRDRTGYWRYGTTTTSTYSTGGGQGHNHGNTGTTNNIPPYIAVNIWQRIS